MYVCMYVGNIVISVIIPSCNNMKIIVQSVLQQYNLATFAFLNVHLDLEVWAHLVFATIKLDQMLHLLNNKENSYELWKFYNSKV